MPTVGIKELKNHLSAFLDKAERGDRITVTKHGRVVAVISPPFEYAPAKELHDMVKEQTAHWSGGKPAGNERPPKVKGKTVAETVLDERR